MGYTTVKFLEEEYQVSETINEFLEYDGLLTPVRIKMLDMVVTDIKRHSKLSWDNAPVSIHETAEKYKKLIEDGVEILMKKMLKMGVYDVTSSRLLQDISAIEDINRVEKSTFATLLQEGNRIADMQQAGMMRAYHYAARNIVGSGVKVFTSSFAMLLINSVVERNIILAQAKKADKEYEEAVKNISAGAIDALDIVCREVVLKEFLPSIIQILLEFDSKVMSVFLLELTIHGKFDFDSIEKYDMQKAEDMLRNINQVSDKIGFLKETFLTCPFCFGVYEECLKQGVLDIVTFETARYFGMGEELAEKMENYMQSNLKNSEKIKPIVSIMALYRGTDDLAIWRKMYGGTLGNIEGTYKMFHSAISDKRKLDKFIRESIIHQMPEIINKSREDIEKSIGNKVNAIVSEKQYNELVAMGLLLPETIRMEASSATLLSDINNEMKYALVECTMEYMAEAKKRFEVYNKAKDLFDKEVKQMEDELSALKYEKEKLGFFAFSKKKEMSKIIDNKASEILEFKRVHEPKDLWQDFERMYR